MKDLIIKTVDFMVIAFVVLVTLAVFIGSWMSGGFFIALVSALIAFVGSSMVAGTWIILTRILDRLKSIDEKLKK